MSIAENLSAVQDAIKTACVKAGRDPQEVTLCAVSKTKLLAAVREAMDAGQTVYGENYAQELNEKFAALPTGVHWHMIGHLQRNKVKDVVGKAELIHSVDSLPLAQQIEKEAAKKGVRVDILLEVNIAGEESKWGFTPQEVSAAAAAVCALPHVHLCGLMTSAPYTDNPETNRVHFRALRALFDTLAAQKLPGADITVLSMGMTGDYRVAVEEGATMVRVGTGIFGAREYPAAH